jgi:hypothetical protein
MRSRACQIARKALTAASGLCQKVANASFLRRERVDARGGLGVKIENAADGVHGAS